MKDLIELIYLWVVVIPLALIGNGIGRIVGAFVGGFLNGYRSVDKYHTK